MTVAETKASNARYRGLLDASPDPTIVVNPAGDILLLNVQAATQFGYRRGELLGQPVKNLIPTGYAERLVADALRTATQARAQNMGTGLELVGLRKDGTTFPLEMLSPLDSEDGVLVTAVIRDITGARPVSGSWSRWTPGTGGCWTHPRMHARRRENRTRREGGGRLRRSRLRYSPGV